MTKSHLLAIPFPSQGNLNAMLQLCRKLESRGILITCLMSIRESEFISSHHDSSFNFLFLPEHLLPGSKFTHSTNPIHFGRIFLESLKSGLPKIIHDIQNNPALPPLSCVLTDVVIVGLEDICSQFHLPKAALSTFSASWTSIQNSLNMLLDRGLLPFRGSEMVIDFVPGLPPIKGADFPSTFQEEDPSDPGRKNQRVRNDIIINRNAWVLFNSFHELEPSQLDQITKGLPHHLPIGPLALPSESSGVGESSAERSGFWNEDLTCLEWLDRQSNRSVIYVSVGSLAILSSKQVSEIHSGLKRSGKKFLWVMRADGSSSGFPVDDDSGKVVAWSPQLKVLKHPAVAAFLTHCGWNSMMEAVVTGTPVLCCPLVFEQGLNCALAVEHWKIGLRLPKHFSSTDVENSVQLLTQDAGAGFRENVSKLSVAAKRSVTDETGASYKNLQAFVDGIKSSVS